MSDDDDGPKIMSDEEIEKKYGAIKGPCRICSGNPDFYLTEDATQDETQEMAHIVPGNYCLPCFLEMYPETEPRMREMAEQVEQLLRKRFSQ